MELDHATSEKLKVCTKRWLNQFVEEISKSAGLTRSQTSYHFSPDGSDETGDGARENPWRSQAKAQEILDQTGDVAILFRRGYVLTDPLTIRHENVTVGSYEDAIDHE